MSAAGWASLAERAFDAALFAYVTGMILYFAYMAFRREAIWWAARIVTVAGLAGNVVAIFSRGMAADRVPWGNMYEYSTLLAALVVGVYLLVVEVRAGIRTLGGFVLMFAVFTLAVAASFFYVPVGPLVPALNSYWIKIHVVAAILGSSLLGVGGVLTILYLIKDRSERRRVAALAAREPKPIMGAGVDLDAPPGYVDGSDDPMGAPGATRGVLPPASTLDRLAYRVIAFAFPIWTFAVIAGAIWAQEAWGRYWGWDPKETWSFITWTIFAGYLHARATSGWRGRRAAVIAVVGFASLLITYYAVNLWIVGLHSYAK
jgi:cytochrome c-type biogenesis protein CcsB